ncbi:MAG: AIR synthase [Clostridiaceae bacterium]|nr:AIR synthase [Clostridiaceae bacterium]
MEIGKVPNSTLERIVFNKLLKNRSEVMIRPGIGMDCTAIDFGSYACVMSSDPITGTAMEIGRLAVHINCNDIASCGVEPLGLLVTILCPAGSSENDLEMIMSQLSSAAQSVNVDILGGHTEITNAVTRFVITCTAVGRCRKDELITTDGARDGDSLVLTKHAGLEGASIIAHEKESELIKALGIQTVNEAKSFIEQISVVKDGLTAADFGVNAMHDITEGGVLGAVWELCEASGTGADIYAEKIPVDMSTRKICEYYDIDPLKLISSGCMLISAADGEGLVKRLDSEGIEACVIGRLNNTGKRRIISSNGIKEIDSPGSDELYKVL